MTLRAMLSPVIRVALVAWLLSAASRSDAAPSEFNSLNSGATSIQLLTFGGGYRGSLRTSGIYLKSHFSDRGALRAGVDFSLSESSGKGSRPPDGGNDRNYYVIAAAEIDEYVDASGPVTAFIGVGPYWAKSREFYERTETYDYDPTTPVTYYSKYERRSWEVGASAVVGVEWFFKRRLSLLGRVGATLGFGKTRERSRDYSTYPSFSETSRRFDASTAQAGTSGAALGLGVYF